MLKPIYYAWFLAEEVKAKLFAAFAPKHAVVYGHHITVAFKPTSEEQMLLNQSLGKTQDIWPDMVLSDEKGQAVFVVTQPVPGEAIGERTPHVTVSCVEGTKPFYSNQLMERWVGGEIELDWLGIEEYRDAKADCEDMEAWNEAHTFSVRFGFFGSDGEVHYELPKEPFVDVSVFSVRGTDEFIGRAVDMVQLNRLCGLALEKCSTGVSLHGAVGKTVLSGAVIASEIDDLLARVSS